MAKKVIPLRRREEFDSRVKEHQVRKMHMEQANDKLFNTAFKGIFLVWFVMLLAVLGFMAWMIYAISKWTGLI
jgi:uncharacterized membrane protein (DUF106 family)